MKRPTILVLSCSILAGALGTVLDGASYPKGFETIFKGIERGKKFYPSWPPMVGQSVVGIMVQAKDPGKPEATFESIESGTFRNAQYTGSFEIGTNEYLSPDYTAERNIDVGVAFTQLDALASTLSGKMPQVALPGSEAKPAATSGAQPNAETPTTPTEGASKAETKPAGDTAQEKVTGVDFKKFSKASLKPGKIIVEYYTLRTLLDIQGNRAVNAVGQAWLTPANRGFVIHRALRMDGVEYTLDSNTDIEAGFFAKLVAWLPGVSVRYKSAKSIALKSSSPVYIGYKVWRPGVGLQGAAAPEDVDLALVGLGAEEIEKELAPIPLRPGK